MTTQNDYKNSILKILKNRSPDKTICPSEVLDKESKQDKELMAAVRAAAVELANQGIIVITQKGEPVDPQNFKGPIRLKLKLL